MKTSTMETVSNHSREMSDLIGHSRAMLRRAEAGEWDSVTRDEVIRRDMIDRYFSEPSNIANEPGISEAIRELLQINDRLEQLTTDARNSAKAEIDTVSTGRKAVNAYTSNAG